jgi:hypothetical protein
MHLATVDTKLNQHASNLPQFNLILLDVLNLEGFGIDLPGHATFGIEVTAQVGDYLSLGGKPRRVISHLEEPG